MMKIDRKIIGWLLAIVLAVAAFIYVKNNFSFGFAPLFCFLILFLLLPLFLKDRVTKIIKDPQTQKSKIVYARTRNGEIKVNAGNSTLCAIAIFVFGLLTLYSLGNYFNPAKEVYSNYQHHALKVEGIKVGKAEQVRQSAFALAGANDNSFFDSPEVNGQIEIVDFDSLSVRLRLKGVTNPVYLKSSTNKHKNWNTKLLSFDKGDVVDLISTEKDENGDPLSCKFVITEGQGRKMFRKIDTTSCVFMDKDTPADVSSFSRYVKSGYSLSGMAADFPSRMDFTGIKIVRDSINLDVKRRDINEVYSERNFLMEFSPDAKIHSVVVNGGEPYVLERQKDVVEYINIPVNRSVYIGLGNHSLNSFRFEVEREGDDHVLYVKYALPHYQYLTSNEGSRSTALMVTTSIIDDETPEDGESGLIDQLTDNVLLFDLFHSYSNRFNIDPFYVSYTAGPTNEKMMFTVSSGDSGVVKHDIPTEQCFPSIKSINGTEWVVKVENFKESTPFGATKIAWIMVVIILLSTFSMMNSSRSGNEEARKSGASLYTSLEYAFHLIIIAFLAVRFFMLWRVTVFPPISSISLFEFEHFRESRWIVFPLLLSGGFYVSVNGLKWYLYHKRNQPRNFARKGDREGLLSRFFGKPAVAIAVIIVSAILVFVTGKLSGSPVLSVFLPIAVYLFFDFCIYKRYSTSYTEDIANSKKMQKEDAGTRTHALLLSIFNMMVTSAVTLVVDGGFGVMFTMFMIFSFLFKVIDLIQFENKRKATSIAAYWVLFLALLIIILSYKDIFISLFHCIQNGSKIWLFFAVAWGVVCLITLLVLLVLNIEFKKIHIALPVAYAVICVAGGFLAPQISGSHMEYRTRVHMETAGDILKSVDSPEAQNKFLQASLNDWILYEYQEIGKEIKSFGEDGYGYFKIQPQSKLGAMWFAQTTDICLSRYIIAEHGTFLAIMFIIAFATVLLLSLLSISCIRWTRIITVQVTLLFAVQALMILLANTRAFIFFGQDFPILSLTSRLSSIYFFCLATVAVGSALLNRYYYDEEVKKEDDEITLVNNSKASCRSMMLFFLLAAAVLYLSSENLNVSDNKKKSKSDKSDSSKRSEEVSKGSYYGERTYDIDEVLRQMNNEIDTYINPTFIDVYQKDSLSSIPALRKNMTPVVEDFLKKFDADSLLANCSDHTRHVFNQFRSTWVKSNSQNNMIYLRYRRSYDKKMKVRDTLEFAVRNEYYRYELPGKSKVQWQGSILGESNKSLSEKPYLKPLGGHSYVYIPAMYSADGAPVQLLKVSGNKALKVISSEAILSMGKSLDIIEIDPMDYIMHSGKPLNDAPLANRDYVAKRILLNGKRQFIYPHGQQLFWARSESANVQRKKRKEKDYSDTDVQFTTDIGLCADIYNTIVAGDNGKKHKNASDRTVVVADGDGNIRALVDFRRDKKYRINPNNYKAIAAVSDSLDMFGERGRATESRYFGDFNRDFLRLGPGSSQKPILWSAVTSMYNTGWWDDLRMAAINLNDYPYLRSIDQKYAEDVSDAERYYFRSFAGYPIETKFRSLRGDEGLVYDSKAKAYKSGDIGLRYYMYKSSNFYNAIVSYIGAFPHSYFESDTFLDVSDSYDKETLFRQKQKVKPIQKTKTEKERKEEEKRFAKDYLNTFPTVYLGNNRPLQFNKFLSHDFATDGTSLAPLGLNSNFGLNTDRQSAYNPSRFNIKIREKRKSARELNEYMVRSVAIGTNTLWQVSPRKMAEMFGKLISMNKAYELSMEHTTPVYEFFELDESWGTGERNKYKAYMKARKELLIGMSQVFSIGTGAGLGLNGKKLDGGYILTVDDGREETDDAKRLYIYGKTGTINGKWGGSDDKEDHLLATVITDKKVSACTPEDLKNMKFYVIYQADFNYSYWKTVDANVILEVLKSDTFKKYMNIK